MKNVYKRENRCELDDVEKFALTKKAKAVQCKLAKIVFEEALQISIRVCC